MAALLNRAKMSTATTGTGTVTLGSAITAFLTFAEAGAVNATVYSYVIEDGNDVEFGIGTYTSSGTTFSRDTVIGSKIGGTAGTSKINLSGSAIIAITALVADIINDIVSQADAEAYTSTVAKAWTAQRVGQAALKRSGARFATTGIADNAVWQINVGESIFAGILTLVSNLTSAGRGVVLVRSASTGSLASTIAVAGTFSYYTTALTGTTGTDGQINIGVDNANPGIIYIENRTGAARNFTATVVW